MPEEFEVPTEDEILRVEEYQKRKRLLEDVERSNKLRKKREDRLKALEDFLVGKEISAIEVIDSSDPMGNDLDVTFYGEVVIKFKNGGQVRLEKEWEGSGIECSVKRSLEDA